MNRYLFFFAFALIQLQLPLTYGAPSLFLQREEVEKIIRVPLDWGRPATSPKIEVSYRILRPDDSRKPLLVFFTGGPGGTSESYANRDDSKGLEALTRHFRVLLFDPRGFGRSSRLNDTHRAAVPELMTRFRSDSVANDVQAILKVELRKNMPYYLFAHSFGGLAATYLLDHVADTPELYPKGVIMWPTRPNSIQRGSS